ncbi:unnamed protein product [Parnassius apollo]|uniref:phospholipase A2 n=1 Tax=Parnassius apollo TaxID=110799 RepID=A0A8S3XV02_PARAO|nr:unnamed protein product [Parnassius apollo]
MELKSPKAKKKLPKLLSWKKMFRTPFLLLLLIGTSTCDNSDTSDNSDISLSFDNSLSNSSVLNNNRFRLRHYHIQPNESLDEKQVLSDIKYLRRHLNREIINFVMTDVLVDGEVENRVHYNGITAKETSVGIDGGGIKLRQLTDGRHLIQVIYTSNGVIQDCEYLADGKTTRNFLKTLRKELKLALDEQTYKILEKDTDIEDERFYRHFGNMTLRLLKENEQLPPDIAEWLNYDRLKIECLERHEELRYIMANKNKVGEQTLIRSRRSFRENLIMPGTKWCGVGQLAERYSELGDDRAEDRCCRAHDNCHVNIGAFRRRFGYFNFRPYTISHCRCDRRYRIDPTGPSSWI